MTVPRAALVGAVHAMAIERSPGLTVSVVRRFVRRGRAGGGVRPEAVAAVVHPAHLHVILRIPGQAGHDVRERAGAGGPDVLDDGPVGVLRLVGAGQDGAQVVGGDGGRARVGRGRPGDGERLAAGRDRVDGGGDGALPVPVDREAPRVEPGGRPPVHVVRDAQRPHAGGVLAKVFGGTEAHVAVQVALAREDAEQRPALPRANEEVLGTARRPCPTAT